MSIPSQDPAVIHALTDGSNQWIANCEIQTINICRINLSMRINSMHPHYLTQIAIMIHGRGWELPKILAKIGCMGFILNSCAHHIICLNFSVYHVCDRFSHHLNESPTLPLLADLCILQVGIRSQHWVRTSSNSSVGWYLKTSIDIEKPLLEGIPVIGSEHKNRWAYWATSSQIIICGSFFIHDGSRRVALVLIQCIYTRFAVDSLILRSFFDWFGAKVIGFISDYI